jgi:hypothetical protein
MRLKNSDHVVKIFKDAGLEVKRLSFFGDCASGTVGSKAFE